MSDSQGGDAAGCASTAPLSDEKDAIQRQVLRGVRRRFCCCSRANAMHGEARAVCVLHGNTKEAKAYRDGMADALNGHALPDARPIRSEDR